MEVEIPGNGDTVDDSSVTVSKDILMLDEKTSRPSEAGEKMVIP